MNAVANNPNANEPAAAPEGSGAAGRRQTVDFWFDPICPWAWMTSRWIHEVAKVREIDVRWHVMSLAVLNDKPSDDVSWLPVRVVAAAADQHGDDVVGRLYTAIGTQIHPGGQKDLRLAVESALAETDLPAELIKYGDTTDYDDRVRESHTDGIERVGQDVGTPVISVDGVAFFGPVVTPAPKGDAAARLFDGVLAVASTPGFFELKRTRTAQPQFD